MHLSRYLIPLAVAASLVMPASASAQAPAPMINLIDEGEGYGASLDIKLFLDPADNARQQCQATFAPTPLTVYGKLRTESNWTLVAQTTDQCVGWDNSVDTSFNLKRRAPYGDAGTGLTVNADGTVTMNDIAQDFPSLLVEGKAPRRNRTYRSQFRVFSAGNLISSFELRTRRTGRGAHSVDQYVNGHYNDDFWNYCILHDRTIRSFHGTFYCIKPGWSRIDSQLV